MELIEVSNIIECIECIETLNIEYNLKLSILTFRIDISLMMISLRL